MKNLKMLCILLAMVLHFSCKSQNDKTYIKSFVKDLSSKSPDYKSIVSDYFCLMKKGNNEKMLDLQLKSVHNDLMKGNLKIENYLEIPVNDQNILIEEGKAKEIYRLTSGKDLICFILLENQRIISISTIRKGQQRIFIKTCD